MISGVMINVLKILKYATVRLGQESSSGANSQRTSLEEAIRGIEKEYGLSSFEDPPVTADQLPALGSAIEVAWGELIDDLDNGFVPAVNIEFFREFMSRELTPELVCRLRQADLNEFKPADYQQELDLALYAKFLALGRATVIGLLTAAEPPTTGSGH
jgi:hypothetical protein